MCGRNVEPTDPASPLPPDLPARILALTRRNSRLVQENEVLRVVVAFLSVFAILVLILVIVLLLEA